MDQLPQHTKAILAKGLYTGMRRGEILGLTWDKVDLEMKVIRLEANDTKDKTSHHFDPARVVRNSEQHPEAAS